MLTYDQALVRAQNHVAELPPIEDCVWSFHDGKSVADGWCFDYVFKALPGKELPMVGGAPGFIISLSGDARVVGWAEFQSLKLHEPKKA